MKIRDMISELQELASKSENGYDTDVPSVFDKRQEEIERLQRRVAQLEYELVETNL